MLDLFTKKLLNKFFSRNKKIIYVTTVINVYSIMILCFNTNYPTKYCRKKFLKYGILCGDIYKAIFKKTFFKTKINLLYHH
jgi:hypothetical protein